jgi:thiol-disulfide isomerase/thioredoxin
LAVIGGTIVCTAGEILAYGPLGACAGVVVGALLGSALADTVGRPAGKQYLGQTAEVAGPTLSGKPLDVADYRGKVVLVDFWATWCPPCRKELPRIRALQDRFASQGFQVVGVSLDTSRDELEEYVKEHDLHWPHIFFTRSGQTGGNNPLVRKYQVKGIPHTLLIDRDGNIVAAGLFGKEVDAAVETLVAHGGNPGRFDSTSLGWLGVREPLIPFFAVVGWLLGMLIERHMRQVG